MALLGGVGGLGCGWGSSGGVCWHSGGTGPGGSGITPTSAWPRSIPSGIGSVSGLKGGISPSKGSVSPSLGVGIGTGALSGAGSCSLSVELPPGSPLAESHLAPPDVEFGLDHPSVASHSVHPTWLPSCFSLPSWASLAWGLSWVLGSLPALPSWFSSWVAAPWIHPLPRQVLVLGASLVMPLGLPVCLDPPPAL